MTLARIAPALCLAIPAAGVLAIDLTHGGFVASVGGAIVDSVAADPIPWVRGGLTLAGVIMGGTCALVALCPAPLHERLSLATIAALGVALVACAQCLGA